MPRMSPNTKQPKSPRGKTVRLPEPLDAIRGRFAVACAELVAHPETSPEAGKLIAEYTTNVLKIIQTDTEGPSECANTRKAQTTTTRRSA